MCLITPRIPSSHNKVYLTKNYYWVCYFCFMRTPPYRTPEQIQEALKLASEARSARCKIKKDMKIGAITFEEALELGRTDPYIGRIKIINLLMFIPGIGIKRAQYILEECGVSLTRRLKGIGKYQKEKLLSSIL